VFASSSVAVLRADDAKDNAKPESTSAEKQDSAAEESPSADPVVEWKKLNDEKLDISKKLQTLKSEFNTADKKRQDEIRDEFQKLIRRFQEKLLPRLIVLAPKVYEKDPKQTDAGILTMEDAFQKNKYEESARIADALIAGGYNEPNVLSVAGVSQFAMHNFEKAVSVFNQAEKAKKLDERAQRFRDAAVDYVDFWKTEQELRERDANAEPGKELPQVEIKTNRGDVILELFENEAPNTVASFISLVEGGTYDGTEFHRVIPNFMAQGGRLNGPDKPPDKFGEVGPGYNIDCECYQDDARKHFRGSLSMAHAGKNTGGSQFFLTHLPTSWLNPQLDLEKGHTVFGRIVKGLDVAASIQVGDQIKSAKVLRKRDHEYKPKTNATPK
jgi:cyclophilin family peptidyl-prolyl cis-trans isomerase